MPTNSSAYAAEIPDLARAAREGYSVTRAVMDRITADVAGDDGQIGKPDEAEERASPSAEAFELHDRVAERLKSIRKPDCVDLLLSRVQRITMPSKDGKFTGVIVEIKSPIGDPRFVVFSAE